MKRETDRRGFFGKAASLAAGMPFLSAGVKTSFGQLAGGNKVKRICVEEHFTAPEVTEAAGAKPNVFSARQADLGEIRLGEMDSAGITMQVISNSSYQVLTDPAKAVELAKKYNDVLAEAVDKHPDRFAGMAALPTQNPKAAADELERTVTKLKFKGAMIEGQDSANWEFLDSPKFRPMWERAAALNVPIYLHPAIPKPADIKMLDGHPELHSLMWAGAVYTATQTLRIIGSGVFDEFPNAKLVLGHIGEILPYWVSRLGKPANWKKPVADYLRENIYVTTSGPYRPAALQCAIDAVGVDHVLFATDFAAARGETAVKYFESTPMSDADREKIYHLNAERIFRL